MKRRALLKQVGAAGLGTAAVVAGSVSASTTEPRRVDVDGETFIVFGDVDAANIDPEGDYCTCDNCDPNICSYCGPCP